MTVFRKTKRDERGAALVEFALILPVFMMMVLGTFTGGIAYNTKQSITSAAREGSRYGATLYTTLATVSAGSESSQNCNSSGTTPNYDGWTNCVINLTMHAASGDLDNGKSNRYICVALVLYNSTAGTSTTYSKTIDASGTYSSLGSTDCYSQNGLGSDGLSTTASRVQVVTKRTKNLEFLVSTNSLTLKSSSLTMYESS